MSNRTAIRHLRNAIDYLSDDRLLDAGNAIAAATAEVDAKLREAR